MITVKITILFAGKAGRRLPAFPAKILSFAGIFFD